MLRSLYSGISGMKNFQTKLDVIGNNISNVNTYGFKKSRTIFQDLYSQSISGASAPSGGLGGTNPKQVGLGSQLASVDIIHTGGSMQTTGRNLDLAIAGDGFFQVADSQSNKFSNIGYTRAGNFYLDKDGKMVNSQGQYLVGFSAIATGNYDPDGAGSAPTVNNIELGPLPKDVDMTKFNFASQTYTGGPAPVNNPTGATFSTATVPVNYAPIKIPTDAQSMSIGQDGSVTYVDQFGTLRWAGQIAVAKFANSGGLEKSGSNIYTSTSNSGTPKIDFPGMSGNGLIQSGSLEMSNVDLSEEFTEMIVAQRGFQSNTKIITTSDEILQELMNLKR
ncbi:flagellar hook-basal body complex protein [Bacillus sp. FJAT-42376]|uniref:flagellar hook-basal body complex protein n=1 Tax=Bacillus sp. FJAT-42376 TaxID=2014076 RepID=UPI000F4DC8A4|nr:flagellar hook-basal body complex protein [Bacillus sp. FJAT-42376]AZB42945.1 flagellar hook-basal body complex protein [Bacillus sp. FJAT-42376]